LPIITVETTPVIGVVSPYGDENDLAHYNVGALDKEGPDHAR